MELVEEQKTKAVKGCKRQLQGVFEPFKMHGFVDFIPGAIEQTIELLLLLHKRLNYIAWLDLDDETREALKEILSYAGLESLFGQDIPVTFEHANGKLRDRYRK